MCYTVYVDYRKFRLMPLTRSFSYIKLHILHENVVLHSGVPDFQPRGNIVSSFPPFSPIFIVSPSHTSSPFSLPLPSVPALPL